MLDCIGRQGHVIWRYSYTIDDLLILMVNSQERTMSNFCWKCWSVVHLTQQTTEQYNTESSCNDLNNSVVVTNVNENTTYENHWLKTCTRTMYARLASTHGPGTSTSTGIEQSSTSTLFPSTISTWYLSSNTAWVRVRVPSTENYDSDFNIAYISCINRNKWNVESGFPIHAARLTYSYHISSIIRQVR